MENQDGKAVIMTSQGEFKRIKINHPIDIGEIYAEKSLVLWKYTAAAVLVLALSLGTIDFFSVKAYAQVSPSVEIGVNRWHIVIAAHALDASGEQILGQSHLIGQKVDAAVERIVDQSVQDGNLEEENLSEQFQVQAAAPGKGDEVFIQRVEENVKEGVKKSIDKKQTKSEKQIQAKEQDQDQVRGQDQGQGQNQDQERGKNDNNKERDKDKDKD